jgi:large subunit ribosomal protein L17
LAWKEKEDVVHILFDKIAPVFKTRPGGYARILRLGERRGDVATMAIIEWVDSTDVAGVSTESAETAK